MPRETKARQLEIGNEQEALDFFARVLGALPDPRRRQGVRYPLRSVVIIALMAMVCGCDDAEAMEAWGDAHAKWLAGFLALPHGIPTQDVFLSVFAALDPKEFGAVLRSWAALLAARISPGEKQIALDGKTSRRSLDAANGQPALHTVSAWLCDAGIVIGQCKTADKSNEITAMPELLRQLDLRSATITTDAMGCQREIAKTIRDGGGDYLLAVKENQHALYEAITETFAAADDARVRTCDEVARPQTESFEETEKGHGRLEQRTVALCRDLTWITTAASWAELSYLVRVTRERTQLVSGKHSSETAYYIGSHRHTTASRAAGHVRQHWSIENKLHWVLDMGFREDEARHRARNTAQNMTILRHFALNLIKLDTSRKLGVANSRKRAGWDRAYLLCLMAQAGS
jgi:predicted transposase YbfD/YdcC